MQSKANSPILKEKLEEKKFYSQSLKEAKKYVSIFEKSLKKPKVILQN